MSELFANIPLKRKGGGDVSANDLKGKVVGLYFSAHWCGPCREFTPILKDFYDELSSTNNFEVIFLTSDNTVEDMESYMKECHGNWLYVPFGDPNIETLSEKYDVQGIPTLVIIKPDGEAVEKDADEDVRERGPKLAMKKWKEMM
uniref:Thioredoxin domain-containing protein n=1 Tax=Panagrolaimus sp. JU765 TaxID=591449 RepID=A0AC34QVJ2_9BILA